MSKIIDLSIAYWRLEKWVAAAPVERKIAAESSLRTFKEFLDENKLKVIDLTGQPYDQGLSVEVMYYEDEDSDDDKPPIITEMMSPIIIQDGNVIKFGQVVIAKNPQNSDSTDDEPLEVASPEVNLPKDIDLKSKIKISKQPYIFYGIPFAVCSVLLICGLVFGSITLKTINETLIKATEERTVIQHKIDSITKKQESIMQEKQDDEKDDILNWKAYIVKKNDSLVSICNKNNINYDAWKQIIISTNSISDVNKISEGQTILIPVVNTND